MNALRHSKIWLSIVLILAVLGHFGLGHRDVSAFVLCFGADGHVAVEKNGKDQSVSLTVVTRFNDETNALTSNDDDPCSSPCTDIPIDGDDHIPLQLTNLLKIAIDIGLLPVFFLISLLVLYAKVVIRQPAFFDPPFTDSRLLALRSTVLLI
ncbi:MULTISPECIES: hypothetical protein [Methylomonas]|uniref:Uncharacterized protein n=1 Tax=Methylomonas methanica TaxID=421 RepID=A0A177MPX1_METMH|nr:MULTISPECIES: hypothetical protein [Methylomonas]OAI06960.1 hypothetical protein A1353_07930 [Methylomonas methanica]PKM13708.1 MAG: hypothetical protein CVV13_00485 [Gammaproteobacteria bacterium HGW-Gammaproteobacteria-3]